MPTVLQSDFDVHLPTWDRDVHDAVLRFENRHRCPPNLLLASEETFAAIEDYVARGPSVGKVRGDAGEHPPVDLAWNLRRLGPQQEGGPVEVGTRGRCRARARAAGLVVCAAHDDRITSDQRTA